MLCGAAAGHGAGLQDLQEVNHERRLVHSLKGVLGSLGYADSSQVARRLEEALAGDADWPDMQPAWADLRQRMVVCFALDSGPL